MPSAIGPGLYSHPKYRYLAPELFAQKRTDVVVDPTKCDIWALGLLCWEACIEGERYWKDSTVKALLDSFEQQTAALDRHLTKIDDGREELFLSEEKFFSIAEQILPAALAQVSTTFHSECLDFFLRKFVRGMLCATLQFDPKKRKADADALPIKVFARDMYARLMFKHNTS